MLHTALPQVLARRFRRCLETICAFVILQENKNKMLQNRVQQLLMNTGGGGVITQEWERTPRLFEILHPLFFPNASLLLIQVPW